MRAIKSAGIGGVDKVVLLGRCNMSIRVPLALVLDGVAGVRRANLGRSSALVTGRLLGIRVGLIKLLDIINCRHFANLLLHIATRFL